jgi:autoinducer 2-degrading protein
MFTLHVNIRIKPEYREAFIAACLENARNSRLEPGVASFDLVEVTGEPTRFELWEVYKTEEAIAEHKTTAHYNKWVETVGHMFDGDRTRTFGKTI